MAARRGRPNKRRELWLAKDPFLKVLQDACRLSHGSASLAVADHERQVEDSFFRAAVALETFLGDWFARCLHFDTSRIASRARDELQRHLTQELAGGWEPEQRILGRTTEHYSPHVAIALDVPKTVSVVTARRLFGTEVSNRSWRNAADLKEQVGRYLAHEPARKAMRELGAREDALLDATIAIRNVLAHRSPQSEDRLSAVLASGDLDGSLQVRKITGAGVGRYLRRVTAGQPRYRRYYLGLTEIANTLAPYVGKPRTICPPS
jgi:hypothetical protein